MSRKEPHEQLSDLGNTHSATVFAWGEQTPREAFLWSILVCLLYTSPSPRDRTRSRMPSSA